MILNIILITLLSVSNASFKFTNKFQPTYYKEWSDKDSCPQTDIAKKQF